MRTEPHRGTLSVRDTSIIHQTLGKSQQRDFGDKFNVQLTGVSGWFRKGSLKKKGMCKKCTVVAINATIAADDKTRQRTEF